MTASKVDILVVDDDIFLAKNITAFLSTHGYNVDYRLSGIEALDAYREYKPAVVLLDIVMPGMSGTDVLLTMMKMDNKPQVIMISGRDDQETVEQAMKTGAYDFISKPILLEILIRKVHLGFLEYLAKQYNVDIEDEIAQHFNKLNLLKDPERKINPHNLDIYMKKMDIEINRELAMIISRINENLRSQET